MIGIEWRNGLHLLQQAFRSMKSPGRARLSNSYAHPAPRGIDMPAKYGRMPKCKKRF
jgi:hypothetical protein